MEDSSSHCPRVNILCSELPVGTSAVVLSLSAARMELLLRSLIIEIPSSQETQNFSFARTVHRYCMLLLSYILRGAKILTDSLSQFQITARM